MTKDSILASHGVDIQQTDALFRYSGGDARKLLNILDLLEQSTMPDKPIVITDSIVTESLQRNPAAYDKNGEMHYDIISAYIKSMRGSDPDAALYWLARMIEGGEQPEFIARRLIIFASEDVGLANPNGLLLANAAFDAVHKVGWPEGRIPLAQATVYLATSPKSNSAYAALDEALAFVKKTGNQPPPLHLRNAPTRMMAEMGYHKGYLYPHDFPGHFVKQNYFPESVGHPVFWHPATDNPAEAKTAAMHYARWHDSNTSEK